MLGLFTTRQFLKYTFMPEFASRLNSLVFSGFHNIPYLLAVVFQMARLIPLGHPYLNPRNVGRFGMRHVIAEAANRLSFSRNNIDQVLIFVAVLFGMALIFVQVLLLLISVLMPSVMAGPLDSWDDFFFLSAADSRQDIAYMMLDLVFGVPAPDFAGALPIATDSFFGSCIGALNPLEKCRDIYNVPILDIDLSHADFAGIGDIPLAASYSPLSMGAGLVFPFPVHYGLFALFTIYNTALLFVAVFIASYFIVTVIAETAQTGTPFGQRFNKLWAPLRIVIAIGLLFPLGIGLNSGQYIVLYAAKFGSAFATNGWNRFNDTLTDGYLNGAADQLISRPTTPRIEDLSLFMWLVNVCFYTGMYQTDTARDTRMYVVGRSNKTPENFLQVAPGTTYLDVINFLDPNPKMITIRFGVRDEEAFPKEDSFVEPTCGEIQIPLTDTAPASLQVGIWAMQTFYFELIKLMWFEGEAASPYNIANTTLGEGSRACAHAYKNIHNKLPGGGVPNCGTAELDTRYIAEVNTIIYDTPLVGLNAVIDGAVDLTVDLLDSGLLNLTPCGGPDGSVGNRGWAAAGIWYNCIAEINGGLTSAVLAVPVQTKFPKAMEDIAKIKAQYNTNTSLKKLFEPSAAGVKDTAMIQNLGKDVQETAILYKAYLEWARSEKINVEDPINNTISEFLGTSGLYDMRENPTVHPLAQLVGIGRALVEAAIRKLGYAFAGAILSNLLDGADGGLSGVAAAVMVNIAMLGLSAGFVLFYIVPFLPFLYFFFAVGGWIKGIFEAMVGVPLWALAHIRIDGHGLPGNAAMNGYFLIFEIFLRPILTLFGLLASISIFSALVFALNNLFDFVVYNVSGFNMKADIEGAAVDSVMQKMRGKIDQFFYTIIYAVLVYMMAMSSFKLIDQIPNNILRWMGQTVPTFGDTREDPAGGLMGRASEGSRQAFGKLGSGLSGIVGAISK